MIQLTVVYLGCQLFHEAIGLIKQMFQRILGTEIQLQIARIHIQLDGVATGLRSYRKGKRTLQRLGGDAQFVQIELSHIHFQFAVQIATVEAHIGIGLHLQQSIVTGQTDRSKLRLQPGIQMYTRHVPRAILQPIQ